MSRLFPSSILGVVVVVATNQTLWDDQNRSAPHEPWGSCIEMFPLACSNSNLSIPLLPEPSWLLSTLSSSSSSQLSRRWMESKGIASPLFMTHLNQRLAHSTFEWRVSIARPMNYKRIALFFKFKWAWEKYTGGLWSSCCFSDHHHGSRQSMWIHYYLLL